MVDTIDFYRYGADAEAFNAYNIEKLPLPQVSLRCNFLVKPEDLDQKSKDSLASRVQNVAAFAPIQASSHETGLYLVDDVVCVQSPTSAERIDKQEFWAYYRNWSVLTGVAGILGAIGSLVALSMAATTFATVALATTAVALTFFAGLSFYRASGAQSQIDQWKQDPLATVAELRANAYAEEGFFYALQYQLQGAYDSGTSLQNGVAKVLHPPELLYLYQKAFQSQKERLDGAALLPAEAQAKELDRFLKQCVLQQQAIEYVHTPLDEMRPRLMQYHAEYQSLHSKMTKVNVYFGEKRREIFGKYDTALKELEAEKTTLLKPYKTQCDKAKGEIDKEYQGLALNGPLTPEQRQEWNARSTRQDDLLKMATTPIETHYSSQKRALATWKNTEIQRVEGNHSTHLIPFFKVAHNLFNRAYQAYIENISGVAAPLPEQEVSQHEPIIVYPIPSAPPMPDWSAIIPHQPSAPGGPTVMEYHNFLNQATHP